MGIKGGPLQSHWDQRESKFDDEPGKTGQGLSLVGLFHPLGCIMQELAGTWAQADLPPATKAQTRRWKKPPGNSPAVATDGHAAHPHFLKTYWNRVRTLQNHLVTTSPQRTFGNKTPLRPSSIVGTSCVAVEEKLALFWADIEVFIRGRGSRLIFQGPVDARHMLWHEGSVGPTWPSIHVGSDATLISKSRVTLFFQYTIEWVLPSIESLTLIV